MARRDIFISEIITKETGDRVVREMKAFDRENDDPINLYLNSEGGSTIAMFQIIDEIKLAKSPVYTICNGIAYSAAGVILAAGTKRFMTENSKVMIHKASRTYFLAMMNQDDLEEELAGIKETNEKVITTLAELTGKDKKEINKDIDGKDLFLNPEDALEYGLVDRIVTKSIKEKYNLIYDGKSAVNQKQEKESNMTKEELIAALSKHGVDVNSLQASAASVEELKGKLTAVQSEVETLKAEKATLQKKADDLAASAEAEKKESAFTKLMAEGKVSKAMKEKLLAKFETSEEMLEFYKDAPMAVNVIEKGSGAEAATDLTDAEKAVLKENSAMTKEQIIAAR